MNKTEPKCPNCKTTKYVIPIIDDKLKYVCIECDYRWNKKGVK